MDAVKVQHVAAEPANNTVLGDVKQGRIVVAAVVAVTIFMMFAIMGLQMFAIQATLQVQTDANDDALHVAGTDHVVRTKNYDFDVSESGLALTRVGVPLSTAKAPTEIIELSAVLPDERFDDMEVLKFDIDGVDFSLKLLGWARIQEESDGGEFATSTVLLLTPVGNLRLVGNELIYPKTVASVIQELDSEVEDEVHGGERNLLSDRRRLPVTSRNRSAAMAVITKYPTYRQVSPVPSIARIPLKLEKEVLLEGSNRKASEISTPSKTLKKVSAPRRVFEARSSDAFLVEEEGHDKVQLSKVQIDDLQSGSKLVHHHFKYASTDTARERRKWLNAPKQWMLDKLSGVYASTKKNYSEGKN